MATNLGEIKLVGSLPTDTNNHSILRSQYEDLKFRVHEITVADVSGSGASFRVLHGVKGVWASAVNANDINYALAWDVAVAANSQARIESEYGWIVRKGELLAVRSSTGSALNFTIWGKVERLNSDEVEYLRSIIGVG